MNETKARKSQKPFGLRFMLNQRRKRNRLRKRNVSKAFRLAVHVELPRFQKQLVFGSLVSKAFRLAVHVEQYLYGNFATIKGKVSKAFRLAVHVERWMMEFKAERGEKVSKAFRLAVHVEPMLRRASVDARNEVSKAFRLAVHVEQNGQGGYHVELFVSQKPFGLRFMLNKGFFQNFRRAPKSLKSLSACGSC